MPISLIFISFIFSLFTKDVRRKKLFLYAGIGLLFLFTNPIISSIAINTWEVSAIRYDEIKHEYEYGVLLTGITDPFKEPNDRIHFNKGSDRVIHTLELYQKRIIKKIIISGGSGSLLHNDISESKSLQSFLLLAGVEESDILIETLSRNTYENALFTKKLLESIYAKEKVLLITSAFHMRRASGCFEKNGINFDCFPTDYYGKPIEFTPDELIIPNVDALKEWTILFKEWIGYSAYTLARYL